MVVSWSRLWAGRRLGWPKPSFSYPGVVVVLRLDHYASQLISGAEWGCAGIGPYRSRTRLWEHKGSGEAREQRCTEAKELSNK